VSDENLIAVVEIPKGSSNKYEWDDELGAIKLDRLLFSSLGYPTDYGFFRNTLAADGDPLDAMIVVSEPTFPGCLIEVKPVALFRMRDQNAEDNKILCVPLSDPNWSHIERLDDLPMTLRDEISHFFLDLQDARVEGGQGRRLVPARGGAGVDRARLQAVQGEVVGRLTRAAEKAIVPAPRAGP
jgi:inorganic pyrophosphatase